MKLEKYLIDAILHEDLEAINLLLSKNIDINFRNEESDTILIIATKNGNYKIVKFLLDSEADVNLYNNISYTPLIYAIQLERNDLVELLLKYGSDPNGIEDEIPLQQALSLDNLKIIKILLDYGADPNSIIDTAILKGKTDAVKLLLDYDAMPNPKNIYKAILLGYKDIAILFKNYIQKEYIYEIAKSPKLQVLQAEIISEIFVIEEFYKLIQNLYNDSFNEIEGNPDFAINLRILIDAWITKDPDPNLIEIKNQIFYPSGRPRTSMSFLKNIKKVTQLPEANIVEARKDNFLIADIATGEYLEPLLFQVLRYASGMYRGLYHGEDPNKKYCGTFYYYDIGSDIFLYSRKTLVANNKIGALRMLHPKKTLSEIARRAPIINNVENLDFFQKYISGGFGDFIENGKYDNSFYAAEDFLDQPICKRAKKLGYDCIILLKMAGKERVVSEILDVRDREISYNSIYNLITI